MFQAAGILPIAAEIRTSEHLVYTPAPDIIHEAAGHAPILPDPIFASFFNVNVDIGRLSTDVAFVVAGCLVAAGLFRLASASMAMKARRISKGNAWPSEKNPRVSSPP